MSDRNETPPSISVVPGWFMATVTVPIVVGLLYYGREFFISLAIALLLFVMTTALVDRIASMRIGTWSPPRWLAHIFGLTIAPSLFAAIAVVLSNDADDFAEAIPRYSERFQALISEIEGLLGAELVGAIERAFTQIDAGAWVAGLANGASGMLAAFSLVVLYLIFLINERQAFVDKLPLIEELVGHETRIEVVLHSISDNVKQYMWINAVTSAMSGIAAYIIFRLIGLDFAATLALIVFLVGFIPNIGAVIGLAVPSLLALLQFDSWTPFLIVLLGYGGADQFISNIIQPAMQRRSLNLSTFMVMVSLSFWGLIWGGIGAFLAVPMMVIFMIVCWEIGPLRPVAVLLSGDGKVGAVDKS